MPAGLDVTVPLPVPGLLTVRLNCSGGALKVAVTVVAAFIVTLHVPVPEHPPPLQPLNVDPPAAPAVSVTTVPLTSDAEHAEPQLNPAVLDGTVPLPVPDLLTVRLNC